MGYGGEDTPKAEIPTTLGVWEDPAEPGVDCNNITRKNYNIDVTSIQVRKKGKIYMITLHIIYTYNVYY